MLNNKSIRVFEKLSGWHEKSNYEHDTGGYVTIEEDVMTGEANAFLWTMSDEDSHVNHLQYLHLGDHVFVKP
jgi:hypothetical protein